MWEGVRGVGPFALRLSNAPSNLHPFALSLSKGRSRMIAVRSAPITGVWGVGPFALREIEGGTGAR